MKWLIIGLALMCACVSLPVDGSSESRQVQTIVRTTNSPFCPGKTLDSCPSPRAAEWRQDINSWVGEGVPESEIRERLQKRVPSFDLSVAPVKSGWIIPVVAVLLSTLWLVFVARALRAPSPPRSRGSRAPNSYASLDARLDEELARLE